MTILLFVLTAVLVGYVVYTFYTSDAGQSSSQPTEAEAPAQPAPEQKPAPKAKKTAAPKPAEPEKAKTETVTEPDESGPTQYRNPETGETAAIPSNYRFAKRWIKEALVAEGLLDKVYKNNELDRNASKKVKAALDKLKELKKYHT